MIDTLNLLPDWLIYSYIFIIGLCIGSFLNVAVLRGLKGEEIVFKHSYCPKCGNDLKWYMNIPIFSYLFLKGKCAFCKNPISIQYPIVEFLNALLYVFAFFTFGYTVKSVLVCVILSLFILLTVTDILKTVIIDCHAFILFGVCLLSANVFGFNIWESIFSSFLVFILFEYLSLSFMVLIGMRCFGFGDSLMLLGICALFDLKSIPSLLFLSFVVQIVLSLIPVFKAKKYRLFFVMLISLSAISTECILLYFKSPYAVPFFYAAAFILLVALFLSLSDIFKPIDTNPIENKTQEDDCYTFKDLIKNIFFSVFVFVFLFLKLKKDEKILSFAYLLYIPILIYLGIYVYFLKDHSAVQNIFSAVSVLCLLLFVFKISSNEEKTQETVLKEVFDVTINKTQDAPELPFTLLPYGPALAITSTMGIFYMDKIQLIFKTIYNEYLTTILGG